MNHIDSHWGPDLSASFSADRYEQFKVSDTNKGKTLVVEGPCPFCAGDVRYLVEREGLPNDPSDIVAQSVSVDVLMIECTCMGEHPGRPAGTRGCGQVWTLEMEES